jgi:hypothetical protein
MPPGRYSTGGVSIQTGSEALTAGSTQAEVAAEAAEAGGVDWEAR